jgi:hypothetical protein
LTVSEPDDKGKTRPIPQPHGQPEHEPTPDSVSESQNVGTLAGPPAPAERQSEPASPSVGTPLGAHAPAERLSEFESPALATPALESVAVLAQPAITQERETVFVPMSVTIGDGFKFGCGFFLALVLAMLVGFVLLAALFALTSFFGLNLPITR